MTRLLHFAGRLHKPFVRLFSSQKVDYPIRNIGIIAHVDAGKTTVTERLLYLAGSTRVVGNVDSGNTVTDFLDMERERGITIQSAAVSFDWMDHRINLVDTPGHVDFTVEVERCVRVLDGVVCVLDGSAGVQAQTMTVWKQSSKFNLPSVFFVNKLDKKGGNFERSVDSIENKLGVRAVNTVIPFYENEGSQLKGLVDLIGGSFLTLEGTDSDWIPVSGGSREYDILHEGRSDMCYALSDVDDIFMNFFLDECGGDASKVDNARLMSVIRGVTLSGNAAAVTCGSALRSTRCVRPVLDHIVHYLSAPEERNTKLREVFNDQFSGFVFKIAHEKRRGQLSYVRVYSGSLRNNSTVFNSNQYKNEGPLRLFTPYADELQPADVVKSGNIAVVSGLSHAVTGDTLIASETVGKSACEIVTELRSAHITETDDDEDIGVMPKYDGDGATVTFSGISTPDSVYFCCVEPPSARRMHDFEKALRELAKEDPSIRVRVDKETGQTIVETQGELHMEVVKDRLVRGYGLDVFVGPLQVAYREILTDEVEHTATVEETMGDKGRIQTASLSMRIEPSSTSSTFKRVEVELPSSAPTVRADWQRAINEGCVNALYNGPIAAFPVHGVKISLTNLVVSGGRINPALLSACAHSCVSQALTKGGAALVEPIMRVEITVSNGEGTQSLLQELAKRRAQIQFCDRVSHDTTSLVAQLPLAEMENLSRVVRTLTSGYGTLHIQVSGYQTVSEFEQIAILRKLKGFA